MHQSGEGYQAVLTGVGSESAETNLARTSISKSVTNHGQGALSGQHVLVTRPSGSAERFVRQLRARGALVTHLPTTRIAPPSQTADLLHALAGMCEVDWVLMTSARAVLALRELTSVLPPGPRFAAIGPQTAEALTTAFGVPCDIPRVFRAEALADMVLSRMPPEARGDVRVMLLQAEQGRRVLRERLDASGVQTQVVPAYRVVTNTAVRDALRDCIASRTLHWITFAAGSAVRSYVELVGCESGGARVAVISPVTGSVGAELGLPADVIATTHTGEGLVESLVSAAGEAKSV